jgi:hypothetical protein
LSADLLFREVPLRAIASIVVSYFLGFFLRCASAFGSHAPIVLLTTPISGPHRAGSQNPLVLGRVASTAVRTGLLTHGAQVLREATLAYPLDRE